MSKPLSVQELDPTIAVRTGRTDSILLLSLWLFRRAFWPMLWLGLTVSAIAGEPLERQMDQVFTVATEGNQGFWGDLLSPYALVILAFASRIVVSGLALVLAYPLTRWSTLAHYDPSHRGRSSFQLWSDRLHLLRAYRSLRWTHAVRSVAIKRLGPLGRRLYLADPVLRWSGVILFLIMIMVMRAGAG